jgi:hypothetical protein
MPNGMLAVFDRPLGFKLDVWRSLNGSCLVRHGEAERGFMLIPT